MVANMGATSGTNSVFTAEQLIHAFRPFDRDGTGLISIAELRCRTLSSPHNLCSVFNFTVLLVLCGLGDALEDAEWEQLVEEFFVAGAMASSDGHVAYEQFVRSVLANATATLADTVSK